MLVEKILFYISLDKLALMVHPISIHPAPGPAASFGFVRHGPYKN